MSALVNVADYFERAAEKVDPKVWCYFEGGAGDEVTLRANVAAYGRWRFRPRVLVDVSEVSAATTVLGTPVSMPLLVAPFAIATAARPGGRGRHRTRRRRRRDGDVRFDDDDERARRDRGSGGLGAALAPALRVARPAAHARPHRRGARARLFRARVDGRPARARPPRARPAARLRAPAGLAAPVPEGQGPERPDDLRRADPGDPVAHVARPRVDCLRERDAADPEGDRHAGGRGARDRARRRRESSSRTTAAASSTGSPATLDALPEVVEAVAGRCEVYVDGGHSARHRRAESPRARRSRDARRAARSRAASPSAARRACSTSSTMLRDEIELGLALLGCTSPDEVTRGHVEPTVPYDPVA